MLLIFLPVTWFFSMCRFPVFPRRLTVACLGMVMVPLLKMAAEGIQEGAAEDVSAGRICNPVSAKDSPDPFVLRVGDEFFAYSTNARGKNFPVHRSRNLADWEELGDALPRLPNWAGPMRSLNWAPGAIQVGDRFILYYTTHYKRNNLQAISYAVSRSPQGPFVDPNRGPVVFQEDEGGSIDPEVFRDHDGQLYLLWKSDANALQLPSALYAQKLAANGRTLLGKPHRLLVMDQRWEEPLIENPSLLHRDGRYYLIYSANWWESEHYVVGYAVADNVFGPYTKQEEGPVLVSSGATRGPGGASFFHDAQGQPWIAYHAWTAPRIGYRAGGARALHLAQVGFDEGRLRFYCWDGQAVAEKKNER